MARAHSRRRLTLDIVPGFDRRGPMTQTSRSYASIVRANVLTVFNLVLGAFGALTLIFGDWRDALFLGIVVANSGIGITQEVRAKHALDRLAVLIAPRATVRRDGGALETVDVGQVLPGDVLRVEAGEQVVADGLLRDTGDLLVDESILTGESEPVTRSAGERLRSGSFVVEGGGWLVVEAVGSQSYAQRLAGEARSFRHPRSPLERATNALLLWLTVAVLLLGTLLGYSLAQRDISTRNAVATATAGVVSLVPEGLMLLTSLVFAVGAVRMARRGVLAQQLNAIESLAACDVICLDKTGTLTEAGLRLRELIPRAGDRQSDVERLLARFAASASAPNRTLETVRAALPAALEQPRAEVAFSSRRRWSGMTLGDLTLVLGAPALFELGELDRARREQAAAGRRVVAFGTMAAPLPERPGDSPPPTRPRALCLVVLGEQLRPHIRETVAYFQTEQVELKVLSGDDPATVAAIAAETGIATGEPLDASAVAPNRLVDAALAATVVGRISPEGKRAVVEAMRERGRYVAMVGDGVNDVPALKASRLAIVQGTGADIAKAVADVVLVSGRFEEVPAMVAEGRQMLRNIGRVARLYVAKAAFAAFLILTIGITDTAYPLLPRHLTLAGTLTVGIPTFLLALAPSSGPWSLESFGQRVSRFAVPAGMMVGVGVDASYLFTLDALGASVPEARTVATGVLVIAGLYLVLTLEGVGGRRGAVVSTGCLLLAAAYVLALVLPDVRHFFDLSRLSPLIALATAGGAATALVALTLSGLSPFHDEAG